MKPYRLFSMIVLLLAADLLFSCCECPDSGFGEYTHTGLLLSNLDNSGIQPFESNTGIIPRNAYGIRLRIRLDSVALVQGGFSILSMPAWATSCECPPPVVYQPRDTVRALRIFTLNEFDATHPAGSDISELIRVFQARRYMSVAEYIRNRTLLQGPIPEPEHLPKTDLLLMQAPSAGGDHRFRVDAELSDGRTLSAETSPVRLL